MRLIGKLIELIFGTRASPATVEKGVELKGGLKHTASSVKIKHDGSLVVELYDFSDDAQQWLGNDVAFLLKVSLADKSRMLSCLLEGQTKMPGPLERDALLLQLLKEQFDSYYEVKRWLDKNKIPYEKEFDPWA
jgi:hypothetical protein